MIVPIATVLLVLLVSIMITRVATIALTLTGMARETARFQARSALTGTGFATLESEAIVAHPVRRRIISVLMLTGSVGIVSIIAGVTLTFTQSTSSRDAVIRLVALAGGVLLLLWLMKLGPVDRTISRMIRWILGRYTDLNVRSYRSLMEVHGDHSIAEMQVRPSDWVDNQTLADLRLNDEGLLVLGVQRPSGEYDGAPTGDTQVHAGDVLVLYGHQDRIAEVDARPKGPAGDAESRKVRRQEAPAHLRARRLKLRRQKSEEPDD